MNQLKFIAVAAAVIGLTTQAKAGFFDGSTDFEGANPLADNLWSNAANAEIVADASVASVPRALNLPPSFDEAIRTNVLDFDTDEAIVRYLQANQEAPSASTIYADFLVKSNPLAADASAPEAAANAKILVYTRICQSGSETNLCVYAKDGANGTAQEFVLTKTIGKDEWHRIVIKATSEGYQVYCDGADAANLCKTSNNVDTFYALHAGAPMTSVTFQGSGSVDDLILSDLDPAQSILTWIGGAQGDWNTAANWDGGQVPTKDTVATFTNDCAVGLYRDSGHCKAVVLDGAAMTLVAAADQGGNYSGSIHLNFHGDNGSAVSGTGTLGVNGISLFNANTSGALTVATALNVLGNVTFKGNQSGNGAGSFTVTGTTTVVDGVNVKTIDKATTTFAGDINVPAGATVLFYASHGATMVVASGSTVTLATGSGTATTFITEGALNTSPNGQFTMNGEVAVDNPTEYTYERSIPASGQVAYTTVAVSSYGFRDPEGRDIEDYGVAEWLSDNGFTQADINALGNNAAGTDKLYYCWLLNLDFTVQDASAALSFTEITVSNRVSMTVQLVRKAPLAGRINGALYIYGANNLAAGFSRSPIPDESVEYFTGDPTFNLVTASNDTVTQTAVATLNSSVTAKFFKATIEVPWVDNGDEPYWEPEPEPEPDPEPEE